MFILDWCFMASNGEIYLYIWRETIVKQLKKTESTPLFNEEEYQSDSQRLGQKYQGVERRSLR